MKEEDILAEKAKITIILRASFISGAFLVGVLTGYLTALVDSSKEIPIKITRIPIEESSFSEGLFKIQQEQQKINEKIEQLKLSSSIIRKQEK